MRSGAILDRSGKPYKPKTVRSYEHALENYIYPLLGSRKVSSLRRADVQGFVEEMRELGAAPSTVHNRLDPLRVIVRRSIDNDELLVDPCARLKMPVVRNCRTRIEPSTTAEALIAALPESEQAFWRWPCSPACGAENYAACRSTTSTSTPGSYTFVADGTTSRARSTRRRSPAPATSQ
jgi:Phage integrase, N-terminal SAM-like domain